MTTKSTHILFFTKYPTPNFAKTRLIPSEGPEGAADVSRKLTERTMRALRQYKNAHSDTAIYLHYAAPPDVKEEAFVEWLGKEDAEVLVKQMIGDLGDKMLAAFNFSFSKGAQRVVVVGSDCPELSADILSQAFTSLSECDLTVGPALDGGYYLLGMNRLQPSLFRDVPWSTSEVLAKTLSIAKEQGITVKKLTPLRDIDTPEDLEYLNNIFHEEQPLRMPRTS